MKLPPQLDPQVVDEWEAWHNVCEEFHRVVEPQAAFREQTGINNPKYNLLVALIELWGERLAELRATQPTEIRVQALAQHEGKVARRKRNG